MPAKILVADDEEKIAKMVGSYLEAAGFEALLAFDGGRALSLFKSESPDCLVLDINMPVADGLEIAKEVRKRSAVPIILLTARTEEIDRVIGLELGADDYISKPFSPRELVARVRAVLRRSSGGGLSAAPDQTAASAPLRRGDLELDLRKRSAIVAGRSVSLTAIQFDILCLLMREPGRVSTASRYSSKPSARATKATSGRSHHIKNIRKAIGDDSEDPKYIGTMRGVGYRFVERSYEA